MATKRRRRAPLPRYRREVVGLLVAGRQMTTTQAIHLVTARDADVRRAWTSGSPPCNVADRLVRKTSGDPSRPSLARILRNPSRFSDAAIREELLRANTHQLLRFLNSKDRRLVGLTRKELLSRGERDPSGRVARDADNPRPGEVYETKYGARWEVTGKTPKGHVLVKRAGHRFEGELQWSPKMLERLKQVRKKEELAVARATAAIEKAPAPPPPEDKGLLGSIFGYDPVRPRRFYVYVIEGIQHGKRVFYVGQGAHTPQKRYEQHLKGKRYCNGCTKRSYIHGATKLRTDLTKRVNPLWSRREAEMVERLITTALRSMGHTVKGGH